MSNLTLPKLYFLFLSALLSLSLCIIQISHLTTCRQKLHCHESKRHILPHNNETYLYQGFKLNGFLFEFKKICKSEFEFSIFNYSSSEKKTEFFKFEFTALFEKRFRCCMIYRKLCKVLLYPLGYFIVGTP